MISLNWASCHKADKIPFPLEASENYLPTYKEFGCVSVGAILNVPWRPCSHPFCSSRNNTPGSKTAPCGLPAFLPWNIQSP